MLSLRLQRIGRRNEAHFKIVVIEKTKGPKSRKYVDIVGSYNPKLGRVQIDDEKAKKWLGHGVQPSDTVYNMLVDKGIIEGKKKNVLPRKSPVIDEEKLAREKAEAEAKVAGEAAEEEVVTDDANAIENTKAESVEENSDAEPAEPAEPAEEQQELSNEEESPSEKNGE